MYCTYLLLLNFFCFKLNNIGDFFLHFRCRINVGWLISCTVLHMLMLREFDQNSKGVCLRNHELTFIFVIADTHIANYSDFSYVYNSLKNHNRQILHTTIQ